MLLLNCLNAEPRRSITLDYVEKAGVKIHLAPHEFDALKLLMSQAGRPVTHAKIRALLRAGDDVTDRAYLRVLIGQLRRKLGDDSTNPTHIETDGYIGYRFRDANLRWACQVLKRRRSRTGPSTSAGI